MITDPFNVLRGQPVRTALFTKADDIASDAQAAALLHAPVAAGAHQVHGNRTIVVRGPLQRTEQADGMITDTPGLALCTRWADCQNFVIYAPDRRVLGVLHAGWRGIIGGAIPEFFQVLRREWGISASDVRVGAGPSLCQACADFTDARTELPGFPPDLLQGNHADLREAARRQFRDAGVPESAFERLPDCTRCDPGTYWTYRGGHRSDVQGKHTNMLAAVLL